MESVQDEDKALKALEQMALEFVTHKRRLAERAKQVAEQITSGQIGDVAALGGVVVELFQELHDTSLSFQQELTELIRAEWATVDDDEDEEDDGDDAGILDLPDEEDPEEDPSQLLPGDAAQLRRTTTDYTAMLNAMIEQLGEQSAEETAKLRVKLADGAASLDLIDALELTEDAPAVAAAEN